MKIRMKTEKVTKNTIRFTEVKEKETDSVKLGIIYVPKTTLGAIGWKQGSEIEIDLEVK